MNSSSIVLRIVFLFVLFFSILAVGNTYKAYLEYQVTTEFIQRNSHQYSPAALPCLIRIPTDSADRAYCAAVSVVPARNQ